MSEKFYMHTISGDVDTLFEWRDDFLSMDKESWGYPEYYDGDFEDWLEVGYLVEVEKNVNGDWVEVE